MQIDSTSSTIQTAGLGLQGSGAGLEGPEASVAMAALQLEEMRGKAERSERRHRREEHRLRCRQLSAERRGARAKMIGGALQGTLQIASGALGLAGARGEGPEPIGATGREAESGSLAGVASGLEAAAQLAEAGASGRAEMQRLQASGHALGGERQEALADEAAEDARRCAQGIDRAFGHLDAIARARTEARLAALRP